MKKNGKQSKIDSQAVAVDLKQYIGKEILVILNNFKNPEKVLVKRVLTKSVLLDNGNEKGEQWYLKENIKFIEEIGDSA